MTIDEMMADAKDLEKECAGAIKAFCLKHNVAVRHLDVELMLLWSGRKNSVILHKAEIEVTI